MKTTNEARLNLIATTAQRLRKKRLASTRSERDIPYLRTGGSPHTAVGNWHTRMVRR